MQPAPLAAGIAGTIHSGDFLREAATAGLGIAQSAWWLFRRWLPAITKVKRIIDVRVHFDVVILADGGGQRLPANIRNNPKVTEARNGWFSHSASHEPSYWQKYGLMTLL
jgi:hypothetical protein